MPPALTVRAVCKAYPGAAQPALSEVALDVAAGDMFGLLGPNGAGKTTLLSIVSGLRRADRGEVRLCGLNADTDGRAFKEALGLVPQELALYPQLSARENLIFFGQMQGLHGARLRERVTAALAAGGLEEYADRRAEHFSGGLKRRLNLAIGLVHLPRVLILDEPTVGIDPQSRRFIQDTLRRLNGEGMTVIYTTHYMEEVEQLCRHVAIIDHGRIVATGALDALLGRERATLEVRTALPLSDAVFAQLSALPTLNNATRHGNTLMAQTVTPEAALAQVLQELRDAGTEVLSARFGAVTLETLFLQLTGTRLRDA